MKKIAVEKSLVVSFSRLKTRADSTLPVRICCSQRGCSACTAHNRGLPETETLYLFTESELN
jgi:hypothetical protein